VNFVLKNEKDEILSTMFQNVFHAASKTVHDLAISASANRIKIWSEEHQIGLEFHYSRKTPSEIEKIIQKDTPKIPDFVGQPAPIDNLEGFYDELSKITEFMPEIAAIGMRRNDAAGTGVRWHIARHIGDDGKIPFLDFISCRLYNGGKCVEFRDGKLSTEGFNLGFCAGNTFRF